MGLSRLEKRALHLQSSKSEAAVVTSDLEGPSVAGLVSPFGSAGLEGKLNYAGRYMFKVLLVIRHERQLHED